MNQRREESQTVVVLLISIWESITSCYSLSLPTSSEERQLYKIHEAVRTTDGFAWLKKCWNVANITAVTIHKVCGHF